MTNVQFYSLLSVALGSLLTVILAWLYSNQRLSRLEVTMDARFARVDAEVISLRDKLGGEMVTLRNTVYQSLVPLHERVAVIEERTK